MPALPSPMHTTAQAIYGAYEARQDDGLRDHLGCSIAGHECDRYLWNEFRWVEQSKWGGQMLRVFDRGKLEERRVHEDLRAINVEVHADDGTEQYRVSAHGGHFGGSMDGVVRGLPEAPKAWHVLEIKTANDKSWRALAKDGLKAANQRHWAQCQLYMRLADLTRTVYISVNKNDESLHVERLELDSDAASALLDRAGRIIFSPEPPAGVSNDPAWWQCKGCKYHPHCHGTAAPLATCRSCAHATPEADGTWSCAEGHPEIAKSPKTGCVQHRFIPLLLGNFAEPVDASGNSVEYRNKLTGATFSNGELSSPEIRACKDKAMLGQERVDPTLRQLREEFGGTYAG